MDELSQNYPKTNWTENKENNYAGFKEQKKSLFLKEKFEPRTLENICTQTGVPEFTLNLVGESYCKIRPSIGAVDCIYRCINPDHNGLHICLYFDMKYKNNIILTTKDDKPD